MPVDKFGRMSDLKTKDTGVSLTYINNNYVRSDGETPLTGSLDMRGNTLYNVADPVNPQDVVTKVYVDNTKGSGVIGRKTGNGVSIKENLDFLGKQKIKNLPDPVNDHDAVTKEYVDTTTTPFLKLDQTKYNTKGDIDMGGQFTVLNVKTPIDDNHIVDKKYVDEMDNLKSAFAFKNGEYYAKGGIIMRKNKLGGLQEPTNDGEAATKKYVDDTTKNLFIDENDNIAFGLNVDMEGNQVLGLPEPTTNQEPATKKYVDDLQNQYIDKRGNIKFDRNINVGNHRIFAVKDPKKDYEATNKKYVDDTINKRLQEEKDNFLPQDPATKEYVDEAIKGLAGGDILVSKEGVFIKANGHYRATAPLDIDNHKMENLPEPLKDGDAVNKKYIDDVVENLTLKQGLIRENGGFNLVDSYINMNFNNIRNVGLPKHNEDAVPRSFVDDMVKKVKETTLKTMGDMIIRLGKTIDEDFKKINHLVTVNASCYKNLKNGDYPFTFGSENKTQKFFSILNGFLVPADGVLKHVSINSTGLVLNVPPNTKLREFYEGTGPNSKLKLYGKNNPTKLFTLEKMKILSGNETEIIGSVFFIIEDDSKEIKGEKYFYMGFPFFEFKPNIKNLDYDKNFICPVKKGDIINIKSEYTETVITDNTIFDANINIKAYPYHFFNYPNVNDELNTYFLHLATLTFMFKETSFPDISDLAALKKITTLIDH